jgi:hypothetical protein
MEQHTRYSLVSAAVQAPGVDMVTKSPNGPLIDTGYNISFMDGRNGARLYLSVETIREMAEIAGLFKIDQPDAVIEHDRAIYNRGYADALKENIGGELRDIADRLGFVSERLGDLVPVATEDNDPAAAELVSIESKRDEKAGAAVPTDRPTRRQGTRSGRGTRSAGVSGNTGDEPRFRI